MWCPWLQCKCVVTLETERRFESERDGYMMATLHFKRIAEEGANGARSNLLVQYKMMTAFFPPFTPIHN